MRYFDDFEPGHVFEFDAWSLTEEEMIAFASEHDPQPMHTDPTSEQAAPFGGVIASGWQTLLKTTTPFLGGIMAETASLTSTGLDDIRWLKPVRADRKYWARTRVTGREESKSRPDRGRVHFEYFSVDEDDEVIFRANGTFYIRRRPSVAD